MNPLILVGIVAGAPLVLAFVSRASSVYLFASVAAGGLLVEYLADDVTLAVNTFAKNGDPTMAVHLALLLIPVVLTWLFLRGTLKASKLVLELIPLLASVAMLVVLLVPELPSDIQRQLMTTPYGRVMHQSQDVVGAAVLLNLGLMWVLRRKRKADDAHGRHGKKHH